MPFKNLNLRILDKVGPNLVNLTPKYSISVQASTRHLADVRNFVGRHAEKQGFKKQDVADIRLAVDEAYTNIIKHSYDNNPSESVQVELGYDDDMFWVALLDNGKPFDPSNYSEPNVEQKIKHKKRGGVGVYLIRKLMDDVSYAQDEEMNIITMIKNKP